MGKVAINQMRCIFFASIFTKNLRINYANAIEILIIKCRLMLISISINRKYAEK